MPLEESFLKVKNVGICGIDFQNKAKVPLGPGLKELFMKSPKGIRQLQALMSVF